MKLTRGNADAAEEIMQAASVKAFASFSSYRRDWPFSSWLNRIMKNLFLDGIRKKHNFDIRLDEEIGEDGQTYADMMIDPSLRPDQSAELIERSSVVASVFSFLNPEDREILQLRELEKLTYEEIANRTGLEIGTVRSRLFRARGNLVQKYQRVYGKH